MRTCLAFVAILLAIGAIVLSVVAWSQFRALAASETINLDDYPVFMALANDLIDESGNGNVDPVELASKVQFRIFAIGGVGILLAIIGFAVLCIGRSGNKVPAKDSS